ncbi:MAG: nicotinate-nucleotide--dimethylbenzimidazole phosphoribosyltransferase [Thainema sp.]
MNAIRTYTQIDQAQRWLDRYRGQPPLFACILGFTATGLLPGISAAGATPADREYTAIADAEFLVDGCTPQPKRPLPPLQAGASPVYISRAVLAAQQIPIRVFNAGLLHPPTVPCVDLGGQAAGCVTTGEAMSLATVQHLLEQGMDWGKRLAETASYLILGECVVGGTTTALAVLTGLGIPAWDKVNSSHVTCNHNQKRQVVEAGLRQFATRYETASAIANLSPQVTIHPPSSHAPSTINSLPNPLALVAAIGDPMQVVVAGMVLTASQTSGVLLAGGTQMLAVYVLARAIATYHHQPWQPENVVVGTTRWVAEDPTGDTVGLTQLVGDVPLLATGLSFESSRHPQLQAYEQGYVKEGVGAGGCAIASSLYGNWSLSQLQAEIEALIDQQIQVSRQRDS